MNDAVRDDSWLVANEQDVAAKVVDGEAILINLTSGLYYSMDKVGGLVWSLIAGGSSVALVAQAVAASYSIPVDRARDDVRRLVQQLLAEKLIAVAAGTGVTAPAAPAPTNSGQYQAPKLTRFDDMADMFALDPPLPELPAVKPPGA